MYIHTEVSFYYNFGFCLSQFAVRQEVCGRANDLSKDKPVAKGLIDLICYTVRKSKSACRISSVPFSK